MGGNGVPKAGRRDLWVVDWVEEGSGEWVMRFEWVTGVFGAEY